MADVHLSYKFYNIPEPKQAIIKDIVTKNLEGKMDVYLKRVHAKQDAQIRLDYKINQNKQGKYEAKFLFVVDGNPFAYSNKIGFKFVEDLVNHAFDRFKEHLSK